jgi:hypothetical protein
MPESQTRTFLVRVELTGLPLLIDRQVEYAKTNIGQAGKAFGDTDVSIGFYDVQGHRTEAVTRNGGETPPEQLDVAA